MDCVGERGEITVMLGRLRRTEIDRREEEEMTKRDVR